MIFGSSSYTMPAVVDANVFMRGKANLEFDSFYTVPAVMEELESTSSRLSFDTSEVEVQKPPKEALERVREKSDEVNSETSDADEQLLALALDLGATLVTDDLGLQNLALHLGADFQAYMGEEVEQERTWKRVCENCGAEVSGDKCSRCGSTQVRRKPDRYSSG